MEPLPNFERLFLHHTLKEASDQINILLSAEPKIEAIKFLLSVIQKTLEVEAEEIITEGVPSIIPQFLLFMENHEDLSESEESEIVIPPRSIPGLIRKQSNSKHQKQRHLANHELYLVRKDRDDTKMRLAYEWKHFKKWIKVQKNTNYMKKSLIEQEIYSEIVGYRKANFKEEKLNEFYKGYLESSIENVVKEIGKWEERINAESDVLELKTQAFKARQEEFMQRKEACLELFNRQKEALDEQEMKLQKAKELLIMEKAVIKIQKWWKKMMILHKLGPYKPKKKKKGKGKKTKK